MKKIFPLIFTIILIFSLSACDLITGGKDDDPSVNNAEDLIDDGDIDEAVDMLEELLDDDDEDYEAWETLVNAFMEDEEWEDAADALEDMGKVIEDNYDEDDDDIEDAMDTYSDLAEDIRDEDDDIDIESIQSIIGIESTISENVDSNNDNNSHDNNIDSSNNNDSNNDDNNNADNTNDDNNNADNANDDNNNNNDIILNTDTMNIHNITLYSGEYSVDIYADGTYEVAFFIPNDDFEYEMGVSASSSIIDIENELSAQIEDEGYIRDVTKTNDSIFFILVSLDTDLTEDYDLIGDYPDYYRDYADYFYNYNTGILMTPNDFDAIPQAIALYLDGNYIDGVYYSFPFDIIAVEADDYTYIDSNTIFVGPDYWGEIVLDGEFY